MHALLSPPDQGAGARVRRGLPDGCAPDRRSQEPQRSGARIPAHAQDSGVETADGDWCEGLLQRAGRSRAVTIRARRSRRGDSRDWRSDMPGVDGFMYPNEVELQWSVLIVLYPFITGLVAGAFILASLERVFNVAAVKPTYRLALLTALAFLLVAPLPLQMHLGHPERSLEMYLTPHTSSAMAMFGFVYLWYLMAVLLLEIWLDYRRDIVLKSQTETGVTRFIYRLLTLGSDVITERSLHIDERLGYFITLVGIPSAFLLHGYVGFIFGSVKANPWWSSPLMPIVFIFSAMVSGIAAVMLLYMLSSRLRGKEINIG